MDKVYLTLKNKITKELFECQSSMTDSFEYICDNVGTLTRVTNLNKCLKM